MLRVVSSRLSFRSSQFFPLQAASLFTSSPSSSSSMAAPGTVTENTLPSGSGIAAENGPVTKDVGSVGPASSTAPVQGLKNLSKVANEIVPHVMNL